MAMLVPTGVAPPRPTSALSEPFDPMDVLVEDAVSDSGIHDFIDHLLAAQPLTGARRAESAEPLKAGLREGSRAAAPRPRRGLWARPMPARLRAPASLAFAAAPSCPWPHAFPSPSRLCRRRARAHAERELSVSVPVDVPTKRQKAAASPPSTVTIGSPVSTLELPADFASHTPSSKPSSGASSPKGSPSHASSHAGGGSLSRKNKPQRCSICKECGHKSRTCRLAQSKGARSPRPAPRVLTQRRPLAMRAKPSLAQAASHCA
jgi:hypothetical protein